MSQTTTENHALKLPSNQEQESTMPPESVFQNFDEKDPMVPNQLTHLDLTQSSFREQKAADRQSPPLAEGSEVLTKSQMRY